MTITVRVAHPEDATGIQAIYAPIVRHTPISFEIDVPTVDEMRTRIGRTLETHPWLVVESDGHVCGYAYATTFRPRRAYQWCADVSVYVEAGSRRSGVARALYTPLFSLLALQGFVTLHAGITLPNPASVGLHESFEFTTVGVLKQVGFKLGAWHDVGVYQKSLGPRGESPNSPVAFHAMDAAQVERCLRPQTRASRF